jgi:hypothetical protein
MVPGCGKTFSTAGNLTRHSKNQHSGTSPPEHGNIESWINPVPFDSKEDEFAVFTDEMVELLRNLEPEAPVYHHPQSRTYHPAPGFFQGILRP